MSQHSCVCLGSVLRIKPPAVNISSAQLIVFIQLRLKCCITLMIALAAFAEKPACLTNDFIKQPTSTIPTYEKSPALREGGEGERLIPDVSSV